MEPALKHLAERTSNPETLSPSAATYCPRQRILKAQYDYYLNPEKRWAAFVGTAVHKMLEDDSEHTEKNLSMTLENGVVLRGTVDHFDEENGIVTDFKTIQSFQRFDPETRKRTNRKLPEDEHVIQLQLYVLLLRANGFSVKTGRIWYIRQDKEATRRLCDVSIWDTVDLEDMALELSEPIRKWKESGELPPAYVPGDEKYRFCQWCPVGDICARLVLDEEDAA